MEFDDGLTTEQLDRAWRLATEDTALVWALGLKAAFSMDEMCRMTLTDEIDPEFEACRAAGLIDGLEPPEVGDAHTRAPAGGAA